MYQLCQRYRILQRRVLWHILNRWASVMFRKLVLIYIQYFLWNYHIVSLECTDWKISYINFVFSLNWNSSNWTHKTTKSKFSQFIPTNYWTCVPLTLFQVQLCLVCLLISLNITRGTDEFPVGREDRDVEAEGWERGKPGPDPIHSGITSQMARAKLKSF